MGSRRRFSVYRLEVPRAGDNDSRLRERKALETMNRRRFIQLSVATLAATALTLSAQTMVPWLTRSGDNQRSGWNNRETVLSQATVGTKGVALKTVVPVYGDARGVEAQPLIVPQVKTPHGTFDVMVLCSMANQCRGVDAFKGTDLWDVTLGTPVTGSRNIDAWGINNFWGALSTGVIDPGDNRFYQVFWASPDGSGSPQSARYYMAVLNVADGSQVVPPVMITGTSQGYDFNAAMRKARSSAVLLNQNGVRTVLQCTGTVQETGNGADGFCFAFDTYLNRVTAMTSTTAGEGAGIWQAGQGPVCDTASTYCYAITGNGDFDGKTQWGESFVQLKYIPPTASTQASLTITKGWSPWTDRQRSGQDQAPQGKLAGMSLPSESARPVGAGMGSPMKNARLVSQVSDQGQPVTLVYPAMATGAWSDEDWGSAGPACIFQIGICVATGKDGLAYPLSVPGFVATTTPGTKANCALLAAPPTWLTMSPGNIDPCPTDPRTLNFFPNGDTAHLHMTPVQMYDPLLKSWVLFVWGENQQLHKWSVSSTGKLSWVANGHEYASANVRDKPPGGMAGGECSGSSNGGDANSAILVCVAPRGDANKTVTQGDVIIYDPVHLGADGYLKKLWSSADWNWNFTANKFMPPMIDGGQIYVPNYSGGIMVLGLAN